MSIKNQKKFSFLFVGVVFILKLLLSVMGDFSVKALLFFAFSSVLSVGWIFLNFNILASRIESEKINVFNNLSVLAVTEIMLPVLLLFILELIESTHLVQYALAALFSKVLATAVIAILLIVAAVNLIYVIKAGKNQKIES